MAEQSANVQDIINVLDNVTVQLERGRLEAAEPIVVNLRKVQDFLQSSKIAPEQVSLLQSHLIGVDSSVRESIRELSSQINMATSYESVRLSAVINERAKIASLLKSIAERLARAKVAG